MNAYAPEIDDLVFDEATRKVGQVVGRVGQCWRLRPPGGGRAWDAQGLLRPPTRAERLSCDVALANARSRGERL